MARIVYYAHCMADYYTVAEATDVKILQQLGFEVMNPSDPAFKGAWKTLGMDFANTLIGECNALAFRRLPNGKIPSGVMYEATIAYSHGMPVFELPHIKTDDVLSREETREYIKERLGPNSWYENR